MPEINTKTTLLLVGVQAGKGQEATLLASTHALAIEERPVMNPGRRQIEGGLTPSLDSDVPLVVKAPTSFSFRTRVRGAGVAYTGLIKPPTAPLWRAAGYKETFQAAIAAAALSAGSATSATLGAAFPATAQALRGMPLNITNNSHSGKFFPIVDYTAGKVATLPDTLSPVLSAADQAGIPACYLYSPTSARTDDVWLTIWRYTDGKLRKMIDCRASVDFSAEAGANGFFDWSLTGSYAGETDAALPTGAVYTQGPPPLFMPGAMGNTMTLDRKAADFATLRIGNGNSLVSNPSFNALSGFKAAQITGRDIRWTTDPEDRLLADADGFNWDSLIDNQTPLIGAIRAGTSVGNRFFATSPALVALDAPEADRNGTGVNTVQLKASGADAGVFYCFA